MIYKKVALNALLLISTMIIGNNADIGVEQLKKDLLSKEIEISEIGKIVIEKQNLIEEMTLKINLLAEKAYESLNDAEKKEFLKKLNSFRNYINDSIARGEIKHSFVKEFCNSNKSDNALERIKFLMMQIFVEEQILRRIIARYEECFQKALEINSKLAVL